MPKQSIDFDTTKSDYFSHCGVRNLDASELVNYVLVQFSFCFFIGFGMLESLES
jgi:hypothetical protein